MMQSVFLAGMYVVLVTVLALVIKRMSDDDDDWPGGCAA